MNKQHERLIHLRERGFNPTSILDVGANVGQWFEIAHDVFPNVPILSVEPNPSSFEKLIKVNQNSTNLLLSDVSDIEVDFYVNGNDSMCTGASIYREQTHHYSEPNIIKLVTSTLDGLHDKFDLVKIDVQGAELDVLRGGIETLKNATFVILELAVMRYNAGAPLINELIRYMDDNNFIIFDVFELHYLNGALNQIDVCFLNDKQKQLVEL
jgi:FkbM family methyltransferase